MHSALLVIDVQQGLCEGEKAAFESERVISRINSVTEKMRAAGGMVIFIQHESMTGDLVFASKSWQLASGLHIEPSDVRLRKTTPDAFNGTNLGDLLSARGIKELVICGMHTEFCVDTTTRRALALGYPVILVEDAHTTESKEHLAAAQIIRHHNATLTNITSFGPRVRTISAEKLNFVP